MAVDVFRWRPLVRKGLGKLLGVLPRCDLEVGFVLEGRLDEELPEVLLGSARFKNLDLRRFSDVNESGW